MTHDIALAGAAAAILLLVAFLLTFHTRLWPAALKPHYPGPVPFSKVGLAPVTEDDRAHYTITAEIRIVVLASGGDCWLQQKWAARDGSFVWRSLPRAQLTDDYKEIED